MPIPATILAFDYGQRRIGIAIGQAVTATARALTTLQNRDGEPPWDEIRRLIEDWRPQLLLVGLPLHADGGDSAFGEATRHFAAALRQHFDLPVELQDEYLSSAEAQTQLREQRRSGARGRRIVKGDVDAVAAALILESWMGKRGDRSP
jgi:putative Holliday junction resolvase